MNAQNSNGPQTLAQARADRDSLNERILELERNDVAQNAEIALLRKDVSEVLSILRASKFGVDVIKFAATVGAASVAIWVAFKTGMRP